MVHLAKTVPTSSPTPRHQHQTRWRDAFSRDNLCGTRLVFKEPHYLPLIFLTASGVTVSMATYVNHVFPLASVPAKVKEAGGGLKEGCINVPQVMATDGVRGYSGYLWRDAIVDWNG